MPRTCLLGCGLAYASPSLLDALHLYLMPRTLAVAWLMPRFLYFMPRLCLLGSGLADASPSLLDAWHLLAWLLLG